MGGGSSAGVDSVGGGVAFGLGGGGSSDGGVRVGDGVALRRGVAEGVGSGSSSSCGELVFCGSSCAGVGVGVASVLEFELTVVPPAPVEVCVGTVAEGTGAPVDGARLLSPAPVGDAPGCTGEALGSATSGCELSFVADESEFRWKAKKTPSRTTSNTAAGIMMRHGLKLATGGGVSKSSCSSATYDCSRACTMVASSCSSLVV
jgi:hypothetical protein